MSPIIKPSLALATLLCLLMLSLAGCGDNNSESHYDPDRGQHPNGWLPAGHVTEALKDFGNCRQCHGADFEGGISRVPCTQCHLGNETDVHPLEWGHLDYDLHGDYMRQRLAAQPDILSAAASCSNIYCHGATLQGVAGSGPSCTSCHTWSPRSVHPETWTRFFTTRPGIAPTILPDHGDYVNANGAATCTIPVCHGNGTNVTVTVGTGSTRFTGTTGAIETIGTGASASVAPGTGVQVVAPTGRLCAACHFLSLIHI